MGFIYVGKIVNTHGIKGEVRVLSDFEYKTYVFKIGMDIYIGNEKSKENITFHRIHKGYDLISLKDYHNINEVLKYKGLKVYVKQEDLELGEKDHLDDDLINMKVYMGDLFIGKVKEIIKTKASSILVVIKDDKRVLIPKVEEIVTITSDRINVKVMEGLIE